METLSELFGSAARVKLMRLFLFNPHTSYSIDALVSKTRLSKTTIRRELRLFEKINFVRRKEVSVKAGKAKRKTGAKKGAAAKKKHTEYTQAPRFIYAPALSSLLSLKDPVSHHEVVDKLKRTGRLRLVTVSGLFIGADSSRVDLLIVGDNLKKRDVERAVQAIESDIGREIAYAAFDTDEFLYRASAKDRLLRDIFDYPHERILEKMSFEVF